MCWHGVAANGEHEKDDLDSFEIRMPGAVWLQLPAFPFRFRLCANGSRCGRDRIRLESPRVVSRVEEALYGGMDRRRPGMLDPHEEIYANRFLPACTQQAKIMSTAGEGELVVTNNRAHYLKM